MYDTDVLKSVRDRTIEQGVMPRLNVLTYLSTAAPSRLAALKTQWQHTYTAHRSELSAESVRLYKDKGNFINMYIDLFGTDEVYKYFNRVDYRPIYSRIFVSDKAFLVDYHAYTYYRDVVAPFFSNRAGGESYPIDIFGID